jgi:hypothetical protein
MRWALVCWLGIVGSLAAPSAWAEEATWGVIVEDAAGDFVTSKWSTGPLRIGSAADNDLVLELLAPHHLIIEAKGQDLWLPRSPDGAAFRVGDQDADAETVLTTASSLSVAGYTLAIVTVDGSARPFDPLEIGERAEGARNGEFEKTAYRFCHDPNFGKNGVVGADFCAILDEKSEDVCPEARAHCKDWVEAQSGKGKGAKGVAKRTPRRQSSPLIPQLPAPVAYAFLGVMVAGLLYWFVRSLRNAGWEKQAVHLEEVQIDEAARNLQALPEAKSSQLLRAAERAHERGDDVEAAVLLHLATLRHLDDEGLARYHSSKTNGDYLRAIRRHKPLAALFRNIANQTERVRFGDGVVERSAIPGLIEQARSLLVKGATRPDAPAVGSALLLLALNLGGNSGCVPQDDPSQAYYEYGPSGMAALPHVLSTAGLNVRVGRDRLIDLGAEVGVVVLRTSAAAHRPWPRKLSADRLLDQGTHVVVIDDLGRAAQMLPVTSTVTGKIGTAVALELYADPERSCVQELVGLDQQASLDPVKIPAGVRFKKDVKTGTVTLSRHPIELVPFIVDDREDAEHWDDAAGLGLAISRIDVVNDTVLPGCIYLFSDRDLFTNASLTRSSNARFVGQLFARLSGGRQVVLLDRLDPWVTSEGEGDKDEAAPDPSRALKASNLLPFLLQALVTLSLLYVFLGAAFGKLRDPAKREHKNFVEHVEALGRHYAAAGNAGLTHAAQSLARLVVMRNRERVRGNAAQTGGWAGLAQDLARQHELPEEDVRSALRLGIEGQSDLGAPTPNDPAPASERMLKTLSRLLSGRSEKLQLKKRKRRSRAP